jgi:hypothetical protein
MIVKLNCNVHLASYEVGAPIEDGCPEYDDDPQPTVMTSAPLNLPAGEYTFLYRYPLSTEAKFTHALTSETSAIDLLTICAEDYRRIYREEDSDGDGPGNVPGLFNRARSHGKYGIWAHGFGDLFLEGVQVRDDKTVSFSIGS